MKFFKNINIKEFSLFFWIVLIGILGVITANIYNKNKDVKIKQIKSSLDNIYLIKTVKEITNSLQPRYTKLIYTSKSGDTYQSIINNLDINLMHKSLESISSKLAEID